MTDDVLTLALLVLAAGGLMLWLVEICRRL